MLVRAEVILFLVAISLAAVAIALAIPSRMMRWRVSVALTFCALTALAPLLLYMTLDPARSRGRALWEWSAVGGPTIQASYRLDGLAAVGVAIGCLYAAAALVATARVPARHHLLRPIILLNAFVFITLAVTDDLIAAIVVLGALAGITAFGTLLVASAPVAARVIAYYAAGVQAFVVSALLVSRFGPASFSFDAIAPTALSPGVVLAASAGAGLFAGLYPFVPWGYRREGTGEREALRGLLTMPAGIGATLLLVRILGATRIDLPTLALPGSVPTWALVTSLAVLAILAFRSARRRRPRRSLVLAAAIVLLLLFYPSLRWSHVVLVAALLTVAYAAAVSLALPEEWQVARHDVALATVWIALSTGSPAALAGAFVALVGDAAGALADAFWMPPHRVYIAVVAAAALTVGGTLAVGFAAIETSDRVVAALAVLAIVAILALELVHVGRRLNVSAVPGSLDATAALAAFLGTVFASLVLAPPLYDAVTVAFARPFPYGLDDLSLAVPALAMSTTLLVIVARSVRQFLPDLAPIGARLDVVVSLADPVPVAAAAFRALERSATTASTVFALFEERAGVWLALVLIVSLLVWAVR